MDEERYRDEVKRAEADYRAEIKRLHAEFLRAMEAIIEAAASLKPAERARVVAKAEREIKAIREEEQLSTLLTVKEGIAMHRRASALADNDPPNGEEGL